MMAVVRPGGHLLCTRPGSGVLALWIHDPLLLALGTAHESEKMRRLMRAGARWDSR